MQVSKIIAAALSLVLLGGVAAAIAKGGEHAATVARESVCTSRTLSVTEQNSCVAQMAAATTQVTKQEVATRFQSKVDTREAVEAAKSSTANQIARR